MATLITEIEQGALRGKIDKDTRGRGFLSFLGVPYAKPPLGKLRFKDPQPPEPWEGVRAAVTPGQGCFSLDYQVGAEELKLVPGGSEDCLFLNIFTHDVLDVEGLKPVMVFFPGGAFTKGSANPLVYGPQVLMTEDIVLVTVNYRVGALGFLSIEDLDIGNAGLKDMVQALRWVQNSILQFGGDPKNVTIFGESAGGAAVQYLVLSPLAKGLFHKAISQSGSALNCWSQGRANNYSELVEVLGCSETSTEAVLEFLQEKPVEKIFEAQSKLRDAFDPSLFRNFGPSVEKPSATAFISEPPIKTICSGNYNKVPFMMGYTSHEGIFMYMTQLIHITAPVDNAVPFFLGYEKDSDEYRELNKKVQQFYFAKDIVVHENKEAKILLATDILFSRGINSSVKAHAKTSSEPVYYYKMTVETSINKMKKLLGLSVSGVAHGEDLGYLFKSSITPEIKKNSSEDFAVRRFAKMWTNFARTGNPIPSKSYLLNVDWKPVTQTSLNYLEIGKELRVGTDPDKERMKFWDKIMAVVPEPY